jgi:hypothetical protein
MCLSFTGGSMVQRAASPHTAYSWHVLLKMVRKNHAKTDLSHQILGGDSKNVHGTT